MIYVNFVLADDNTEMTEVCAEVPQVGDSVMLGGKFREVRHRRWIPALDDGISDLRKLMPEIVVY